MIASAAFRTFTFYDVQLVVFEQYRSQAADFGVVLND
jgi:hypothetical protein